MDEIDDLVVDEKYEWAVDTLGGIFETVGKNEHATDRQKEAVENIRRSKEWQR